MVRGFRMTSEKGAGNSDGRCARVGEQGGWTSACECGRECYQYITRATLLMHAGVGDYLYDDHLDARMTSIYTDSPCCTRTSNLSQGPPSLGYRLL